MLYFKGLFVIFTKLAMAADKWYRVPWNVGHMVALRAYTSRQIAGLKVYLLLRNEIKMPTLGVEVPSNSMQDFE